MSLLDALKAATNFTETENGGITHKTTQSKVLDMFAMGGAYRSRSEKDKIKLFADAYAEDATLALKCLFYLRDVRGGQGEREFFRICLHWLAQLYPAVAYRVMRHVAEFGRYDDLYAYVGTPDEKYMFEYVSDQLVNDLHSEHPSLLAKWLKSENTSSAKSREMAKKTRLAMKLSPKQYRQMLSMLRRKIDIVERKMSDDKWKEIKYENVPSKAGILYSDAFLRHDHDRYSEFIGSKETKVHAGALYPYEVVDKAIDVWRKDPQTTERQAVNKYWQNLTDYFKGKSFNALAMVDTSGSMCGRPIDVAISLGLYCAERAKGPFQNHYISFSSKPQLIETSGYDFVDKVWQIYKTNLCENTNIEAAFDLVLDTAVKNHMKQEDLPENILVISDMEFDEARSMDYHFNWYTGRREFEENDDPETTMDKIMDKWKAAGYEAPHLIYWNVDARQDNIPSIGEKISFVSGFSPSIFESLLSGKTGYELMLEKLLSDRYAPIV